MTIGIQAVRTSHAISSALRFATLTLNRRAGRMGCTCWGACSVHTRTKRPHGTFTWPLRPNQPCSRHLRYAGITRVEICQNIEIELAPSPRHRPSSLPTRPCVRWALCLVKRSAASWRHSRRCAPALKSNMHSILFRGTDRVI